MIFPAGGLYPICTWDHHPVGTPFLTNQDLSGSDMSGKRVSSQVYSIPCPSYPSLSPAENLWDPLPDQVVEFQDPKMEVLYHMFGHILGAYPFT